MTSAQQRQFKNQKALQDYAEAHDLEYVWEGMKSFAKRWRLAQLAQPGTYEVEVRTKCGVTHALLFPKAILRAGFEADAPMREAMRIKRERLRAKKPPGSANKTVMDLQACSHGTLFCAVMVHWETV